MAIRYISDWHYGHKNCLVFDRRPFASVEEMNEALVRRWNAVVNRGDTVYLLGDIFWCGAAAAVPVLKAMKGRKVLIRGNHDRCGDPDFRAQFELIADYLEIRDAGRSVVLCHYPIPCFKNHAEGWLHLFGHVHLSPEAELMEQTRQSVQTISGCPCRMYNTGSMLPYMDYTPRTLDEIISGAGLDLA